MKVKIIKPEYIRIFGGVYVDLSVDRAIHFEKLGVCMILGEKSDQEEEIDKKKWTTPENKNNKMIIAEEDTKEIKGIFPQIDEMEEGK